MLVMVAETMQFWMVVVGVDDGAGIGHGQRGAVDDATIAGTVAVE